MKEQMVEEGGKESDTDMDRDLEEVEQKQSGSRRSLYDTENILTWQLRGRKVMMTARNTNNEQMAELSDIDLLMIMMVEWNWKIAVGLLEDNVFLNIEDKLGMIF